MFFDGKKILLDVESSLLFLVGERFVYLAVLPDKGSEARSFYCLICHVGRGKLHDGAVLIGGTEAADSLSAVYIIAPYGYSPDAGNSRQETRKG